MDNSDHFRNFQNTLRNTLSQPISHEHPISLEQLASGVSNQGFFARNLSALRGHEVISSSAALSILSKNNFELFNTINQLFLKSQQPENLPPMQKSRPQSEHRYYPQYSHDMATLYQLVKLINKPKIGDLVIEQTKQPIVDKIKDDLKNSRNAIVQLAGKQIGLNNSMKLQDNTSAFRANVLPVMENLRNNVIHHYMKSAEAAIRNLPESHEKNALIKEYMQLSDILKSDNLVEAAKDLLKEEARKPMTEEDAIRNIVSNFTYVLGEKSPITGGSLFAIKSFEKPFRELARLNPAHKNTIKTFGNGIQEFGKLCTELEPYFRVPQGGDAKNLPPIPEETRIRILRSLNELKNQVSADAVPGSCKILIAHYHIRIGIAQRQLNEHP